MHVCPERSQVEFPRFLRRLSEHLDSALDFSSSRSVFCRFSHSFLSPPPSRLQFFAVSGASRKGTHRGGPGSPTSLQTVRHDRGKKKIDLRF
ncbi:hypothetical protein CDAR_317761 [Caerostris darwini]|uniref:Uncharacterized protein n=1 Tax=Caerostris darwini TaxID=1538125 RepID=A0AAV4WS38_9ARAC|nr:hypothetical protein CDAR_317761 [Caerostris darwini]